MSKEWSSHFTFVQSPGVSISKGLTFKFFKVAIFKVAMACGVGVEDLFG